MKEGCDGKKIKRNAVGSHSTPFGIRASMSTSLGRPTSQTRVRSSNDREFSQVNRRFCYELYCVLSMLMLINRTSPHFHSSAVAGLLGYVSSKGCVCVGLFRRPFRLGLSFNAGGYLPRRH